MALSNKCRLFQPEELWVTQPASTQTWYSWSLSLEGSYALPSLPGFYLSLGPSLDLPSPRSLLGPSSVRLGAPPHVFPRQPLPLHLIMHTMTFVPSLVSHPIRLEPLEGRDCGHLIEPCICFIQNNARHTTGV